MKKDQKETILAECYLRMRNDVGDKNHYCALTETKLFVRRTNNEYNYTLKNISSVRRRQQINWVWLILGALIMLFAILNVKFFQVDIAASSEKPKTVVYASVFDISDLNDETPTLNGLNPSLKNNSENTSEIAQEKKEIKLEGLKLQDPPALQGLKNNPSHSETNLQNELQPLESLRDDRLLALDVILKKKQDVEDFSYGIGFIGFCIFAFGLKRQSFLTINVGGEMVHLRIYRNTQNFEHFYKTLQDLIGKVKTV